MHLKTVFLFLCLSLVSSACKYQNHFEGKLENKLKNSSSENATLQVYSKNPEKKCIEFTLETANQTLKLAIDPVEKSAIESPLNEFKFNNLTQNCNQNAKEYLDGKRSVKIQNQQHLTLLEHCSANKCRFVSYLEYFYTEQIDFNLYQKSTRTFLGHFEGTSATKTYIDDSKPQQIGSCDQACPVPGKNLK